MNLFELLEHVGIENVTLQPLERDMHSIDMSKKYGCAMVQFGTKAITAGEIVSDSPTRKVGFVIWIQKDKLPREVAATEEEQSGVSDKGSQP